MNFVADEGVDAPIVKKIRESGYNVFYIAEEERGISDEEILQIANDEERI